MTETRDRIAEVLAQHVPPNFETWAEVYNAAEPAVQRTVWKCMCGWRSDVQAGFDPTPAHQHVADALLAAFPALHPGETRTEWGLRHPEDGSRPDVVCRTVTTTEWATPEENP